MTEQELEKKVGKAILLLGLQGSSKSLISRYFNEKYGFQVHRTGEKVREYMQERGMKMNRASVAETSERLRKSFDSGSICEIYLDNIKKLKEGETIVVDSPKNNFDVNFYKRYFKTYIVGVFASQNDRFGRVNERRRADCPQDFDDFLKRDELEARDIGGLFILSDYLIITRNHRYQDVYQQAEKVLRSIRRRK